MPLNDHMTQTFRSNSRQLVDPVLGTLPLDNQLTRTVRNNSRRLVQLKNEEVGESAKAGYDPVLRFIALVIICVTDQRLHDLIRNKESPRPALTPVHGWSI